MQVELGTPETSENGLDDETQDPSPGDDSPKDTGTEGSEKTNDETNPDPADDSSEPTDEDEFNAKMMEYNGVSKYFVTPAELNARKRHREKVAKKDKREARARGALYLNPESSSEEEKEEDIYVEVDSSEEEGGAVFNTGYRSGGDEDLELPVGSRGGAAPKGTTSGSRKRAAMAAVFADEGYKMPPLPRSRDSTDMFAYSKTKGFGSGPSTAYRLPSASSTLGGSTGIGTGSRSTSYGGSTLFGSNGAGPGNSTGRKPLSGLGYGWPVPGFGTEVPVHFNTSNLPGAFGHVDPITGKTAFKGEPSLGSPNGNFGGFMTNMERLRKLQRERGKGPIDLSQEGEPDERTVLEKLEALSRDLHALAGLDAKSIEDTAATAGTEAVTSESIVGDLNEVSRGFTKLYKGIKNVGRRGKRDKKDRGKKSDNTGGGGAGNNNDPTGSSTGQTSGGGGGGSGGSGSGDDDGYGKDKGKGKGKGKGKDRGTDSETESETESENENGEGNRESAGEGNRNGNGTACDQQRCHEARRLQALEDQGRDLENQGRRHFDDLVNLRTIDREQGAHLEALRSSVANHTTDLAEADRRIRADAQRLDDLARTSGNHDNDIRVMNERIRVHDDRLEGLDGSARTHLDLITGLQGENTTLGAQVQTHEDRIVDLRTDANAFNAANLDNRVRALEQNPGIEQVRGLLDAEQTRRTALEGRVGALEQPPVGNVETRMAQLEAQQAARTGVLEATQTLQQTDLAAQGAWIQETAARFGSDEWLAAWVIKTWRMTGVFGQIILAVFSLLLACFWLGGVLIDNFPSW
ncbi:hypothetical protein PG997_001858 [Apiospora hydei]|uniref:t-SNARE coiled-coil homology domain-containing protein n=1 Tax=Apiospora hydei TaxID=1337664 RepID=A0ABR1X7S3_9PEZI